MKSEESDQLSEDEIARRRDDTIRRMIQMPAKTQKGQPKRAPSNVKKKTKQQRF